MKIDRMPPAVRLALVDALMEQHGHVSGLSKQNIFQLTKLGLVCAKPAPRSQGEVDINSMVEGAKKMLSEGDWIAAYRALSVAADTYNRAHSVIHVLTPNGAEVARRLKDGRRPSDGKQEVHRVNPDYLMGIVRVSLRGH